ncbi:exported hypothetical protein [metagenome]|uniref:Uncharacterized protein n=1 Tax=metagenome TaxID=256318 RepID=A0A2P2CB05_9ZZZZ
MRRATWVCGVALLTGVLLGQSESALADPPWTPPEALSGKVSDNPAPRVAAAGDGDATVVWRKDVVRGARIMASWRSDGGAWSAPMNLSGTGRNGWQRVVMNQRQAVVVWKSAGRLMVSRHRATSGWTPPREVTESPITAMRSLDVAMDDRGHVSIAWSEWDPHVALSPGVQVVRQRADGRWSRPARVSGPPSTRRIDLSARLAVDGRGDVTVVWARSRDTGCAVFAAGHPRGAGTWSTPDRLGSGCRHGPWVTSNARGDTAANWVTGTIDGVDDRFVKTAIRPAGGDWEVTRLSSHVHNDADEIALDDAGNALVVWGHSDSEPGPPTPYAAQRPAGGSWGAPFALSPPEVGACAADSRVATNGDGTATVVWLRYPSCAGADEVRGVQRTAAGEWGDIGSVSGAAVSLRRYIIDVAIDAAGNSVAIWTEIAHTGDRVMGSSR